MSTLTKWNYRYGENLPLVYNGELRVISRWIQLNLDKRQVGNVKGGD